MVLCRDIAFLLCVNVFLFIVLFLPEFLAHFILHSLAIIILHLTIIVPLLPQIQSDITLCCRLWPMSKRRSRGLEPREEVDGE